VIPTSPGQPRSVHVVVPETNASRTRGFIVVRRTSGEIAVGDRGLVAYVDRPTAVIAATRRAPDFSSSIAYLSLALQRRLVTALAGREASI